MKNYEQEFFRRVKKVLKIEKEGEISLFEAERYLFKTGKDKEFPTLKNIFLKLHDENMSVEEEQQLLKMYLEGEVGVTYE